MASGGWVRDKHLGQTSEKISFMVISEKEGLTASNFAAMVQDYQN